MKKTNHASEYLDDYPENSGIYRMKIEGLKEVGEFEFELHGVQYMEFDHSLIETAIANIPDSQELMDKICQLIYRHKLIRLLESRIK